MSAERFPTETDEEREAALDAASRAVRLGRLVVLPTDTVYGVGADAFDPEAVTRLLAAKGRGREMPPPVLVGTKGTLEALATRVPAYVTPLVERFWPGALTIVCHQQPSLQWDLGETRGTVAIRMPDHAVARELLDRTGPLAVSSANLSGSPAALDADAALEMLGESVAVVVDAGASPGGVPSTIVDATGERPRLLRLGAIPVADLDAALADLGVTVQVEPDDAPDEPEEPEGQGAAPADA
ncbi:L-threonylcarbamoyladenylate synthase [Nocardioides nitrophenolicus]|uniref:L-threonylcarbamoyladenylate synthase n=1 Tax=Nocardioides nitrophenolicus TaxID=60489 RepID=UPI0027DE5D7B|nr:L-threonylcarbamoyladenylate synthase [Nocardioides nitrophenolicus]MBM7515492.1 tRNA threonylcarbamoyl adenosine modification protein (Sua5/YciO/YrdC/YwlC family) [Nocardioides nitrophenolicus]